jgi:hypothetical protein
MAPSSAAKSPDGLRAFMPPMLSPATHVPKKSLRGHSKAVAPG